MPLSQKRNNLDEKFGACRIPGQVADCERRSSQKSCFAFDTSGAKKLKSLADLADGGFYLSHAVYSDFTVLWLVNSEGELFVSLEEVIIEEQDEDGSVLTYPLARALDWRKFDISRLGHPAIVKGAGARIGGELHYRPGATGGNWWLTNKSGRYGIGPDRTKDHLNEVAKIFRSRGVNVVTFFHE